MDVAGELERLGGVAGRKALLAVATRGEIERAAERGEIRRIGRGRFCLPTDVEAQAAAHALKGTAILLSAAAHWGWARKWSPRHPQVAVPKGRKVSASTREDHDVRWRSIPSEDVVDGWVTSRPRTLIDCAVLLPFDEALAVADSALRAGLGKKDRAELQRLRRGVAPQHRPKVERVLASADAGAAGPFESVLRAITLDVPGLDVEPQVRIDDGDGWIGRVDLADLGLRLVLEADSMEYHGERSAQDRDCARYTRLTSSGWLVLRFTWEQVMHQPDWVRAQISSAVDLRRSQLACCLPENYTPVVA
jgi:very-short-patch-repair endonuclease